MIGLDQTLLTLVYSEQEKFAVAATTHKMTSNRQSAMSLQSQIHILLQVPPIHSTSIQHNLNLIASSASQCKNIPVWSLAGFQRGCLFTSRASTKYSEQIAKNQAVPHRSHQPLNID